MLCFPLHVENAVCRKFFNADDDTDTKEVFTKDDNEYNAYEKDIATAHFYFGTPTITEFRRMETMTPTGFLSQVSLSALTDMTAMRHILQGDPK